MSVLLNVALMCATPFTTFRRTFFLLAMESNLVLRPVGGLTPALRDV
jgi:hypothetical protein